VEALLPKARRGEARWVAVAKASLEEGDPRASVVWAERGLAAEPEEAEALQVAGMSLYGAGSFVAAERTLRAAADRNPAASIDDDLELADTLVSLSAIAHFMDRREDARELAERALRIAGGVNNGYTPEHVGALWLIGNDLVYQGKPSDACDVLDRAVEIAARLRGEGSYLHCESYRLLAASRGMSEGYAVTIDLLEAYQPAVIAKLGREHHLYASILATKAIALGALNKLDEASESFQEAITIREKTIGSSHPFLADELLLLASIQSSRGRLEEAEALARRSATILEQIFGQDHQKYGFSLFTLAGILIAKGSPAEALIVLLRVLVIFEHSTVEKNFIISTVFGISLALAHVGDLDMAASYAQRAVDLARQFPGSGNSSLSRALQVQAFVQARRGASNASSLAQEALALSTPEQELVPLLKHIART
jgi:tetratricopeptide (TPR) repeat protein